MRQQPSARETVKQQQQNHYHLQMRYAMGVNKDENPIAAAIVRLQQIHDANAPRAMRKARKRNQGGQEYGREPDVSLTNLRQAYASSNRKKFREIYKEQREQELKEEKAEAEAAQIRAEADAFEAIGNIPVEGAPTIKAYTHNRVIISTVSCFYGR